MESVKIDEKGRVLIRKSLRERIKIRKGDHVRIKVDGKKSSSSL